MGFECGKEGDQQGDQGEVEAFLSAGPMRSRSCAPVSLGPKDSSGVATALLMSPALVRNIPIHVVPLKGINGQRYR